MKKYLALSLFILLTACQPPLETIEVTRIVATAVPTIISSPTAFPLPTVTVTKAALATVTATATPLPPTITPTATATAAMPTPTPAISLNEFLATLQTNLNARDYDALKGMVTRRFMQNVYPIRKDRLEQMEGLGTLMRGWSDAYTPEIIINEENILSQVAEPFMPETVLGTDQAITAVVHSSGWGTAGTMQALLYITVENGAYTWAGILASNDNFAVVPELPLMPPPPGLVYQLNNMWWYINESGAAESLPVDSSSLSVNPGGTLALYADSGHHQVRLFPWPMGDEEIITLDGTLLYGSWHMPWLDDETVLLILGPYDEGVTQGSIGNLAFLNVLEGTVTTLPPQFSIYDYPSVTANGGVLYNKDNEIHLWRDGTDLVLNFARTISVSGESKEILALYEPVMSPDGHYVAGVSGVEHGRYSSAYILADLTNQMTTFLLPYVHLPTDAALSYGIHWSPDSQWLALDPPVWIWDNNVPIISAVNPDNTLLLGAGTSRPLWLDSKQLLFRSVNYEQVRWRYMDLQTGEQFWLDLPDGVEVVHYVPPN